MNPATAETTKKTWMERFGAKSWDEFTVKGEERGEMLKSFEAALGELARVYGQTKGVWLEGEGPCYADLIVGGWVGMVKETMGEWEEVRRWHGGFLGRLDEALGGWAVVR